MAVIQQIKAKDLDGRQARQAGMPAQKFHITEQEKQANAPCHRAERQIVAGELEGKRANHNRHRRGQHQPNQQSQPRRAAHHTQPDRQVAGGGQPRRGVRPQPDKSRLPKAGQTAHAGQQHQAQRDQGRQPDIVQQGDVKRRQHQRCQQQTAQKPRQHSTRGNPTLFIAPTHHMCGFFLFHMVGGPRQPHQHRNNQGKHQHVFKRTRPKRRERLQQPNHNRTCCCQRIAGQPADNGRHKALQPNQKAAVVVNRSQRCHQQPRQRPNQRGKKEGLPPSQGR